MPTEDKELRWNECPWKQVKRHQQPSQLSLLSRICIRRQNLFQHLQRDYFTGLLLYKFLAINYKRLTFCNKKQIFFSLEKKILKLTNKTHTHTKTNQKTTTMLKSVVKITRRGQRRQQNQNSFLLSTFFLQTIENNFKNIWLFNKLVDSMILWF